MPKRMIVGITGASGAVYAVAVIKALLSLNCHVDGILTKMGEKVLAYECGEALRDLGPGFQLHPIDDLFSALASGSNRTEGMIVVPCSMNTLGLMANGVGENLLARVAQVTLKEKRPLVVVPREMPYNIIHLENMLRLARAGGTILPASPGFYHNPEHITDLVNHVAGRVLDQFGLEHNLYRRWQSELD